MPREIPINEWGKDHWSTFAYVASCTEEHQGVLDSRKLRHDGIKYPTILKITKEPDHNDYHCLDDLEREGFMENHGTGFNRVMKLTEKGLEARKQLGCHKQDGGSFNTFAFKE